MAKRDSVKRPEEFDSERLLETCWRVVVAPDGYMATCAIFERPEAGLQVRVAWGDRQVLRRHIVPDTESARAVASMWLTEARAYGGFPVIPRA